MHTADNTGNEARTKRSSTRLSCCTPLKECAWLACGSTMPCASTMSRTILIVSGLAGLRHFARGDLSALHARNGAVCYMIDLRVATRLFFIYHRSERGRGQKVCHVFV